MMRSRRAFRLSVFWLACTAVLLAGTVLWATDTPSRVAPVGAADLPALEVSPREPWNEAPAPTESRAAAEADPDEPISVLVHLDPRTDGVQRPGVKSFAVGRGAYTKYEYEHVLPHVINIRNLARRDVKALLSLPGVIRVEEDYEVTIHHNDSMPLIRAYQSQVQAAGFNVDGAGVRVCVIDTGIDSNAIMYSSRIDTAAGWDFVNGDSNPEDDNGHGSHVAGTVLGGFITADFSCATTGPESMQGVAPAATLIGIKALSASGSGSASGIIAGINRCASPTLPGGPADVINMSLGGGQFSGTCDSDSMAVASNNAVNAGLVVVASAGNSNFSNAMGTPACASGVISVGATYDDNFPNCDFPSQSSFSFCTNSTCSTTCTDNSPDVDQRVCFSNRSSQLDVTAPGCITFSDNSAVAGGNGLTGFCGTSQASPHVAGLAALLLDLDPTLTPAEVRQLIRDGAVDLGTAGFDASYGHGRIDAVNSLALAAPPSGCTTDPQCDDGLFCNGLETCVAGACQPGTAPNCNDGIACTIDSCNELADACANAADHLACSDGLFCNGAETCSVTRGCTTGSDPCTGLGCNETTDTCVVADTRLLRVAFLGNTSVPGVGTVTNEDIVVYSYATGTWSLLFDGSDVGLSALALDGLSVLSNGNILMSFTAAGTVAGLVGGPSGTTVDDSDVVRFVPTTLGANTAGTFHFYFDGSDVGLTTDAEDIDAISVHTDGRLMFSTLGASAVPGVSSGADEDLLIFNATSLGAATAGSWSLFFDGGDVLLTNANENVDAAHYTSTGTLLLSTTGAFAVNGASGPDEDIFEFIPSQYGSVTVGSYAPYADLTALGIPGTADVVAVSLGSN